MDNEIWSEALNEVSDAHLEEALNLPKKKKIPWLGVIASTVAAAMVLVLVTPLIMLVLFLQPHGSTPGQTTDFHTDPTVTGNTTAPPLALAERISQPSDPRNQTYQEQLTILPLSRQAVFLSHNFMTESTAMVLSNTGGNALWSPISAYMALATTAYLTSDNTQQELLDALGAENSEDLIRQASAIWESVYYEGEYEKSLLAGSVWLDSKLSYHQPLLASLSYDLYSSVYHADLGTAEADAAIRRWVNENTGNLLTDAAESISLPEETALAIYSTIYFRSKWQDEFHPGNSRELIFHSPNGDVTCTYMTKQGYVTNYFWDNDFGAVCLTLKNGSKMWLILPDEGVSVDSLLQSGSYMQLATCGFDSTIGEYNWRDQTRTRVNLSVPKFDISAKVELDPILQELGISDIFDPMSADFSAAFPDSTLWLQGANQAIRVAIDEEGATAAAYTEFPFPGAAPPPEEIIDFMLDRPFLFVITQEDIPLFAGVVNDPSS